MTAYTAQFAEHRLTRKSDREYSHAWIVTFKGMIAYKGFSARRDLAEKAARACVPAPISTKSKIRNKRSYAQLAREAGLTLTEWYAKRDEDLKATLRTMKIEIVEVEKG